MRSVGLSLWLLATLASPVFAASHWPALLSAAQTAFEREDHRTAARLAKRLRSTSSVTAPVTAAWCLEGRAEGARGDVSAADAALRVCLDRLEGAGAGRSPTALMAREAHVAVAVGRGDAVETVARARALLERQTVSQIVWAIDPDTGLLRHRATGFGFPASLTGLVRSRITTPWITGEDVGVSYGGEAPRLAVSLLLTRMDPDTAVADGIESSRTLYRQLWRGFAVVREEAFAVPERPTFEGRHAVFAGTSAAGQATEAGIWVVRSGDWRLKATLTYAPTPQARARAEAFIAALPWAELQPTRGA
jgi:hypothetical protein